MQVGQPKAERRPQVTGGRLSIYIKRAFTEPDLPFNKKAGKRKYEGDYDPIQTQSDGSGHPRLHLHINIYSVESIFDLKRVHKRPVPWK